jgi:cell division septation protein DedD
VAGAEVDPKPAADKSAPVAPTKGDASPPAAVDPALAAFVTSRKEHQGHAAVVEVMALSHESDADAMLAALRRQGYEASVSHVQQDSLLHVNVGPFTSIAEAESMRERLQHDGYDAIIR